MFGQELGTGEITQEEIHKALRTGDESSLHRLPEDCSVSALAWTGTSPGTEAGARRKRKEKKGEAKLFP